jgi:hypothetical protein
MTHPLQLLRWGWPRSQSIDPPQYILEQFPRDLGHLEMTVPCTRVEQTPLH